jgi:hypothetical protein
MAVVNRHDPQIVEWPDGGSHEGDDHRSGRRRRWRVLAGFVGVNLVFFALALVMTTVTSMGGGDVYVVVGAVAAMLVAIAASLLHYAIRG